MIRRILFVTTVAFTSLVLFAGTAFAHFCYVASRSPQGARMAAMHSDSFGNIEEFLASMGMCADGIAHVEAQVEEATGIDASVIAINERTVMAQGHLRSGKNLHLAADGHGVDYLTEEMFAAFEGWVEEAFALCGGA